MTRQRQRSTKSLVYPVYPPLDPSDALSIESSVLRHEVRCAREAVRLRVLAYADIWRCVMLQPSRALTAHAACFQARRINDHPV
eukprot:53316-Eustigmatos_ZCMA.PRE.1